MPTPTPPLASAVCERLAGSMSYSHRDRTATDPTVTGKLHRSHLVGRPTSRSARLTAKLIRKTADDLNREVIEPSGSDHGYGIDLEQQAGV